jgi:hypothetical protein
MKRRVDIFQIQRAINEFPDEPLLAVRAGVALQELCDLVGVGERALLVVGPSRGIVTILAAVVGGAFFSGSLRPGLRIVIRCPMGCRFVCYWRGWQSRVTNCTRCRLNRRQPTDEGGSSRVALP